MKVKMPFSKLFILLLGIGVIACLFYIGNAQLDNREASLMSVILALLSIIASYLVGQHFAERGHKEAIEEIKQQNKENLKTYALNAAEKVDNLSKELKRLSLFLEDELGVDFENALEGYHSRTDKLESAVHIINTLKSVNDTSLSDWRGVIPEELEEKDEEQLETAFALSDLMGKLENLTKDSLKTTPDFDSHHLQEEVNDLKEQLIQVSRKIDGIRIRPKSNVSKPDKVSVKNACPNCGEIISYRQRPMASSRKMVTCTSCKEKCNSRWCPEVGFTLEQNLPVEEEIKCPSCGFFFKEGVNSFLNSPRDVLCPKCHSALRITRRVDGIKTKILSGPLSEKHDKETCRIDDNILEKVMETLPPQPWPKGTHTVVSEKLGISVSDFNISIKELIKRGKVQPQIDGVLYYPQENSSVDKKNVEQN